MDRVQIDDKLSVGIDQPTLGELSELAEDGFRTVIDLRLPGEPGLLMQPEAEDFAAQAEGLEYVHLPVAGDHLSDDLVRRFRQEVQRRPGPILVHCGSGERSAALAMRYIRADHAIGDDDAMDVDGDTGELAHFVRRYAGEHPAH